MTTPTPSPRRSILVVDDSSLNRDMLSDFIDLLGHDVRLAENGLKGLESMRESPPDILLLDLDMPVMNGIEVLEHLAADDDLKHIPVIVISGRDDMEHMARVIALGATDFLSKPFNPTILEARLGSSIEKKDLRDRERDLLHSLEKSYADLRLAEESRDALTHMIVHDLGNPLSVIAMNIELLQMMSSLGANLKPESVNERLGYMGSASKTMGTMIQSMLDVSKLESGKMPVTIEPVSIRPLLSRIADQNRGAATEHAILLEVEVDPESITGLADALLLERIVTNLLTNAFKYAANATTIVLSATLGPDGIEMAVTDDGSGIPERLHDRIFEKYYQAESAEDRVRTGVGLGLAFCKMATEAMNGSIRVETAQPHGTRFVVSLPVEGPTP
jgi:two-component system sensor histidine kinase/response regulator